MHLCAACKVRFLFYFFFFSIQLNQDFNGIEILEIRLAESRKLVCIPNNQMKKWRSVCPHMSSHSTGKPIYGMDFNFNMQMFQMESGPENKVHDGNDVTIIVYGFINMDIGQWTASREISNFFSPLHVE